LNESAKGGAVSGLAGGMGFAVGLLLGQAITLVFAVPLIAVVSIPDSALGVKIVAGVASFGFAVAAIVALGSAMGRRPEIGVPLVVGLGIGPALRALLMLVSSADHMLTLASFVAGVAYLGVMLLGFMDGRRVLAERQAKTDSAAEHREQAPA
jgi:threonine/homoserine/homoserine lactone efflux protein